MFVKSRDEMKKPTSHNQAPQRPAQVSSTPSILAADVEIQGNLRSLGELQLEGRIVGDLECKNLVMGESGSIEGSIKAETVTIRGTVNGEIHAKTVALERSAVVNGDVYHESLSVEAGAKLTGRFTHGSTPAHRGAAPDETPSFVTSEKASAAE